MKKRRQDLIYIYDNDRQKIILIDSQTGERVEKENDKVISFLLYLQNESETAFLRKFAVWCAHEISGEIKPIQRKILDLAKQAIQQQAGQKDLRTLYSKTEATAIASDTVGLQQGKQGAIAYLAARESINPDALEGATQAARFYRIWAEIQQQAEENEQEDAVLQEIKAQATEDAVQRAEEKQINFLLDLMNTAEL